MADTPSDGIQKMIDAGVFEVPSSVGSIFRTTPDAKPTSTLSNLAGSLTSGEGGVFSDQDVRIPTRQPSFITKALGFCLKSRFTSSGSLYDDSQALFIGPPGQAGVPEGPACPQEATNYQLFIKADTMQTLNHPSFSLQGGSFFEFQNLYLKHVAKGFESAELIQARRVLRDAKTKKDEKWERGCAAFAQTDVDSGSDKQKSLIEFLAADKDYIDAWQAEEASQQAYTHLLSPSMTSLSGLLDLVRLADMRLEPQEGNNMPVIAGSVDWITQMMNSPDPNVKPLFDTKAIYYRPCYGLPHYETIYDYWVKSDISKSVAEPDGPYMIPLAGVWDRSWSDLGHPLLDQAKPPQALTDEQKNFINSLRASITFVQKPYAINVNAGPWRVNDMRSLFKLSATAPPELERKVCRTSTMILAWGVELEITLPEMTTTSAERHLTLAQMDLYLKEVGTDGKTLRFQAGNDAYPLLLGIIADVV